MDDDGPSWADTWHGCAAILGLGLLLGLAGAGVVTLLLVLLGRF